MKTAILHLGTHKAASTSIQVFLSRNRDKLRKVGVYYPFPPQSPRFAHHSIAWDLAKPFNPKEKRPSTYVLSQAIEDFEKSACHTLLLSSEDFLDVSFYEGCLESLFKSLRTRVDRIVVSAFVRGRKGFFTSSYNQWAKSMRYYEDVDAYLGRMVKSQRAEMRYTAALEQWASWSDQQIYMPFLPKSFPFGVEREFITKLDIGGKKPGAFGRNPDRPANASIGPLSVVAFRLLAEELENCSWFLWNDLDKRNQFRGAAIEMTEKLGWNKEPFHIFTEHRLSAIREHFFPGDQRFAQKYFNMDWDTAFPDDGLPDQCTEVRLEDLPAQESEAVHAFVTRMLAYARKIFRQ